MQLEDVLNGGNPILSAQSSLQRVFWKQIGVYLSNQCDPFIHVSFRAAKNYRERMKIDKKWICGGETLAKAHRTQGLSWVLSPKQLLLSQLFTPIFIKIQPQDLDQTSTSIYWQKIFKILIKLQPQNLVQLNFNQSTSRVERLFTSARPMRSVKLGRGNELYFHQFQTRPPSGDIFVVDSFCTSLVSGTTSQLELCSSIEVLSSTARVTTVKFTR